MSDEAVNIAIKARDEATNVITRTRGKIEQQLKGFERSFTELNSKLSFVGQAGRVAFDAITAGIKMANGDLEGMQKIVEALPMGIGEIASAMRRLGEEINGVAEEARRFARINEKQKALDEKNKRRGDIKARMAAIGAGFARPATAEEAIDQRYATARDELDKLKKELDKIGTAADKLAFGDATIALTKWHAEQKRFFQLVRAEAQWQERQRRKLGGGAGGMFGGAGLAGFKGIGQSVIDAIGNGGGGDAHKQQGGGGLGALFGGDNLALRPRQMQASPLAPVIESGSGRTAAARAERQTEFIRRQTEQQRQLNESNKRQEGLLDEIVKALRNGQPIVVGGIG